MSMDDSLDQSLICHEVIEATPVNTKDDLSFTLSQATDIISPSLDEEALAMKRRTENRTVIHMDEDVTPPMEDLDFIRRTKCFEKEYKYDRFLVAGTFGFVKKGHWGNGHDPVAIKQFSSKMGDASIFSELLIYNKLAPLNHPYIARFQEAVLDTTSNLYYAVLDYYPQSLLDRLKEYGAQRSVVAAKMCFQLSSAVACLHGMNIIHRDLKPANVMLTDNGDVKLIDFGLSYDPEAKDASGFKNFHVVTANYRAMELVLGDYRYGVKIDIWSLACVFYQIYHGSLLFNLVQDSYDDDNNTPYLIVEAHALALGIPAAKDWSVLPFLPYYNKYITRFLIARKNKGVNYPNKLDRIIYKPWCVSDIFDRMLSYNPDKRPSAKEVHEFISKYQETQSMFNKY